MNTFDLPQPAQSEKDPVAETVRQMQDLRKEIEGSIVRLQELSAGLRTAVMRNPTETATSYLVFANAHLRLAGALSQGVRRAASMDRVLVIAQAELEETRRRDEEERQWADQRRQREQVAQLQAPTESDFDDLYGEMTHAE